MRDDFAQLGTVSGGPTMPTLVTGPSKAEAALPRLEARSERQKAENAPNPPSYPSITNWLVNMSVASAS